MFGLEFLLALLPQALGAGATAAGTAATAAGASGLGGMLGAAGTGLTGLGSTLGGLGSMGSLTGMLGQGLSQASPSTIQGMQNMGLLGKTVDATGGMETSITNPNNIGGGLLGNAARAAPKSLGMLGEAMMQQSMRPQQPMQAPSAPGPMYSGQQQPIARSRRDEEEEMRKRRLAYLTRRY
jgi:hypothetical protein